MNKTLKVFLIVLAVLAALALLAGFFAFNRHGMFTFPRHMLYHSMPHMFGGFLLMGMLIRFIGFAIPVALLAWLFWYLVNKVADKKAASMNKEATVEASKPKVCPNCGKNVEEGWVACPHCGTKL